MNNPYNHYQCYECRNYTDFAAWVCVAGLFEPICPGCLVAEDVEEYDRTEAEEKELNFEED